MMLPADVNVADAAGTSVGPLVLGTPRKGMVTPGMVFSNGGKLGSVLIIATAAAPCLWPNVARSMRGQVPRIVTTSLPATSELGYSASLQPSEMEPFALRSTTIGSVPLGNGALLALIARTT